MLGVIFRIAFFIGGLCVGWKFGRKISKWLTKKHNKKTWDIKREKLLHYVTRISGEYIDVKKIAQVSFERFLKLYEVSPEKWIITDESTYTTSAYDEFFPIYKYDADASKIPLFWETGEDLQKYREWVKEKFVKGDAALYQQARDESMKLLTKFIKEDLERKRKRAEKEMEELEAQIKKECEQAKEKQKEIQLTLESSYDQSSNSYTQFYPYVTYFQVQNVGAKESVMQEVARLQTNIAQSMQSQMIQQQLNNVAVMPTGWRY